MNSSIVRVILGNVLKLEAILMLIPSGVSLIYQEKSGIYLLISAMICYVAGFFLTIKKAKDNVFYLKEGCVATASSWIVLSIFGALPFWLSGEIPSYIDALFETASGFTTTGASILNNVEGLSYCMLFWRSFTHWIGGMGVLVFLLAILPMTGGSNMNIMKAESPGPTVGKLVPKVRYTARLLYIMYFGMTALEMILLLIAHMPMFDAITLSFGTAGTGGFGILNDSITSYSAAQQWIITIFMILFGVNFNAYYFILLKQFKKAAVMEEIRVYIIVIIATTVVIAWNISSLIPNTADAIRHAAFQVGSLMTSTGYSTADFDTWPQLSRTLLVMLMFVGACAGSTGGGLKVSRIIIMIKNLKNELHSYINPKSIRVVKMDGKSVEPEVCRSVNVYFVTFALIYVGSMLVISLDNFDFTTNFTSIIATINNIGPGLAKVGPTCNFSEFSILSKIVLTFDMLAGRLELFPMLLLFHPSIWKDLGRKRFGFGMRRIFVKNK